MYRTKARTVSARKGRDGPRQPIRQAAGHRVREHVGKRVVVPSRTVGTTVEAGLQIHCASWPTFASQKGFEAIYDNGVDSLSRAHALSGQCFVIVAQNPVTQEYLDVIEDGLGPQSDLAVGGGSSAIYGPAGLPVAGPHTGAEEKLVVAEIDLGDIAFNKILVDSAGHYSRPEVLQQYSTGSFRG